MPCTLAQLKKAAKWRENNRNKSREIVGISRRNHYNNNRDKENNRVLRVYYFKKECKRLMNILL